MVVYRPSLFPKIKFIAKYLTVVLRFENGEGMFNIPSVHAGLGCRVEKQGFVVSDKMLVST